MRIPITQSAADMESIPVPVKVDGEMIQKSLLRVFSDEGLIHSMSEGRRLIAQHAIKVDGKLIEDPSIALQVSQLPVSIRVGKHEKVIQEIEGQNS